MALAIDTSTATGSTGASSQTFSYTCTGSNLILIVGVCSFDTTLGNRSVSSVTYNSVALTPLTAQDLSSVSGRVQLFYLIGPATGAHNIIVTMGGTATAFDIGVVSFTGCDPSSGFNAQNGNTFTSTTSASINTSSTVDNCVLIDAMNGNVGPMSFGSGQTQIMKRSGSTAMMGYRAIGAAGSYVSTYTTSSNDDYEIASIIIAPVTAGGGTIITPLRTLMGVGT